jgi:hypothetical protein
MTIVAALRRTGPTVPMVLDGSMTGPAFLAYVPQVLVPTLEPATSSCSTTCRRTRSATSAPSSARLQLAAA